MYFYGGITLKRTFFRNYGTFIFVTLIFWFSGYVYMPVLTPFVESLGGSLKMVGLVIGSYGFTQMVLRIPLGIYSDWISKRKVFVILGVALSGLSALGLGLASNPWFALLFRSLAGAAAATWVVFTVLFSSYFTIADLPRAMGIIMFFNKLGQMSGTLIGGFISDLFGQRAPFIVGGIVGVLGLLLSFRIKEQEFTRPRMNINDLVNVGKDALLIKVSILAIIVQAISFSTTFGFTPSYAVNIGASDMQLSTLMFIASLSAALSSLVSGNLAQTLGEKRLIVYSFIASGIAAGMIPFSGNILMLYLTQLILGVANGLCFPLLMGMSIKTIDQSKRSTAMGFFQAIYGLGMFAGPVIVGIIADTLGLSIGFYSVGLIALFGAVFGYLTINSSQVQDRGLSV